MNEAEFQKLMETSWRRKLTAPEEAALNEYLATHFEGRNRWEDETGLNQLIGKLPEAQVSTNFTARVLQAVEREAKVVVRDESGIFHWLKSNWLPRVAITALLVGVGFFSFQQHKRTQVALDIKAVSKVATVPSQWLQDFDAINHLSQPPADTDLLAALE